MEPRGMRRGRGDRRGRGRSQRGGPMVGLYSSAEEELPYITNATKLSSVEERRIRQEWGYEVARGAPRRGRPARPTRAGSRFSPYPAPEPSVAFVPRRRGQAPPEPEAPLSARFEARRSPTARFKGRRHEPRPLKESGEIVETDLPERPQAARRSYSPRQRRMDPSPKTARGAPDEREDKAMPDADRPAEETERRERRPTVDPSASPLDLVIDFDEDPEETAALEDREAEEEEEEEEVPQRMEEASPVRAFAAEEPKAPVRAGSEQKLKQIASSSGRGRRAKPRRGGARRRPLPSRDRPMYGDPEDWLPREPPPPPLQPTYPQRPPRGPRPEYDDWRERRPSADGFVTYRTIPEGLLYDIEDRRQYMRAERYYPVEERLAPRVVVERQMVVADMPPPRERRRLQGTWDERSPPMPRAPRWEEPTRGGYGGRGRPRSPPPRRVGQQVYYSDY